MFFHSRLIGGVPPQQAEVCPSSWLHCAHAVASGARNPACRRAAAHRRRGTQTIDAASALCGPAAGRWDAHAQRVPRRDAACRVVGRACRGGAGAHAKSLCSARRRLIGAVESAKLAGPHGARRAECDHRAARGIRLSIGAQPDGGQMRRHQGGHVGHAAPTLGSSRTCHQPSMCAQMWFLYEVPC